MFSLSPLAQAIHFASPIPKVTVLHVADDVSDLTTYTFTGVNFGNIGATASIAGQTVLTFPNVRSQCRSYIAVIVHGEDAATVFDVSSVTIGGVSGTERQDRAGATVAINHAIYTFDTDSLQDITSTDVVVTWSEAVTGCAVGVLLIENTGVHIPVISAAGGTGTGVVSATPTVPINLADRYQLILAASTCDTGGGTEKVQFYIGEATSSESPLVAPRLLYEGSNAEFDYAAAWSYSPGYNPTVMAISATWSGTGNSTISSQVMY